MTEQVYNSTSLTLTNLTRGENYSFAVAVTDSVGQYGAWSEQLNVAWNGNHLHITFLILPSPLHVCNTSLSIYMQCSPFLLIIHCVI